MRRSLLLLLIGLLALLALGSAHADVDNLDLLDGVLTRFQDVITPMGTRITAEATRLFWSLATISMVWRFGQLALQKADIGDFFAEFFRYIMFTGFFWWLLMNGPNFSVSIMTSMRQLGGEATGLNTALSPSNIVDVGFSIFDRVAQNASNWSFANSVTGMMVAAVVLVVLALVAVSMLILLIKGWILAYAGAFFLGFGGSPWTSDMAVGYFKTVLNIGGQLLGMVVLVGIGNAILIDYYTQLSSRATIQELGVFLVLAAVLLALVREIPPMVGSLAGGAMLGSGLGAGSAARGAQMVGAGITSTAGVASTAGGLIGAGVMGGMGGASAIMAAIKEGSANTAAGTDIMSRMAGSEGGMSLGQAMGIGTGVGQSGSSSGSSTAGVGSSGAGQQSGSGFGSSTQTGAGQGGSSRASTSTGAGSSTASADAGQGADSKDAGGQARDGAGAKGSGGGGSAGQGTLLGMAATGARVAADAAANLGLGGWDAASAQVKALKGEAKDRIGETIGGQVAAQIHARGAAGRQAASQGEPDLEPEFDGNTLAAANETEIDPESEIAAFVNRKSEV